MRVLVFHGYLLRGTGSNVYNASLAQALAGVGHEVHLLCQDRRAEQHGWVNSVGRWRHGRLQVEAVREPTGEGSVTVYNPEIGGLLPVYVADRYEGFEVKTFPELSDQELQRYLEANVFAVRDVMAAAGEPGAALANHLIMAPAIMARAGVPEFAIKVHGSDISYTVRPHPGRFVPYAREGAEAARGLLVGSSHTAEALWEVLDDPGLREKTRLGPPGVDTEGFEQRGPEEAAAGLGRLVAELEAEGPAAAGDSFSRDGPAAAAAVRHWAEGSPRVLFVGKLIVSKGVDLLLAAWPLVVREHPGARLLLVGFGDYRAGLERLWAALEHGDLDDAAAVAAAGRGLEGEGPGEPLPILSAFLADPPSGYAEAAHAAAGSVALAGRLDHDEVAEAMPAADAFAMPSTWPEAFGMVAAEAAACGVPPVSADHSGMREVSSRLAEAVPPELAPLLSFEAAPGAVGALAERLDGWLSLDSGRRAKAGAALAARVEELWSWRRVAEDVLDASGGKLNRMPRA